MKESKLIQRLQILSNTEFKHFDKWLKSPWCNSNKTLIKFYAILKPHHPDFDSKQLSKEKTFQKLYPGKSYNAPWMHNLISELFQQLEQFQIHESLRQNTPQSRFYLAKVFLEKNRPDLFLRESRQAIERLEKKPHKGLEDLYQFIFYHEHLYQMPDSKEAYAALEHFDHYLDQFYALGKSRSFLEAVEGGKTYSEDQLSYLENLSHQDFSPSIKLYQAYFKYRTASPKVRFNKLEELFQKHFDAFHKKDQRIILTLLLNENARRLRTEDDQIALFEKAFELYQIGLKHQLLLYNGYMHIGTYANIVATSSFLKKMEFSSHFIEAYYPLLDSKIRDDVYDWAKVHLAFNTNDPQLWQLAKKLIQKKPSNNHFAIRARILVTQIWTEDFIQQKEKDYDFILNSCSTFERQLSRNKFLSLDNTNALKRLVYYLKKLIIIATDKRYVFEKISALETAVAGEKNLHGKTWLLIKINEIKENQNPSKF